MAISFPASPLLNDTYTVGSKTWIWNGYAWDLSVTNIGPFANTSNAAFATANAAFAQANSAVFSLTPANNWANTINTAIQTQFAAVNNYSVFVGASANNWANTKLANTSGVSFAGNLYFPTGNVGIGTTSPAAKLHVNGDIITGNATFGSASTDQITITGKLSLVNGSVFAIPNTSVVTSFDADPTDSTNKVFAYRVYPTISYDPVSLTNGDSVSSAVISSVFKASSNLSSGAIYGYGIFGALSTDAASSGGYQNHDLRGIYGNLYHYHNSNLVRMVGVAGRTYNRGTGTVGAAYSLWARTSTSTGGGVITQSHGIFVDDISGGTNNYGITSTVSSGSNKWNFYASGSAQNYFAGNVGIGITSPTSNLHVIGSANISDATLIVAGQNVLSLISTVGASGNNWANTINTAIQTQFPAVNNYTISVGASANNYAGTMANAANAYATATYPTKTGTGASGDWAINVTGYSGRITSKDTRAIATTPETTSTTGIYADFKQNSTEGLSDGGTYFGEITYRPYGTNTDWSGGPAHQLGMTNNGNIWYRYGSGANTANWSTWRQLAWSDSITSANAYSGAMANSSNNWANTINTALQTRDTAGNNFTISVGASGNNWANSVNTYSDSTYFKKTGGMVSGDVQITGNLNVMGNVTFTNTNSVVVSDPLLYLAGNNYTSDIVDIGIVANYVNSTFANVHTGIFRDSTSKEWFVFEGYSQEPVNNHIDTNGNNFTLSVLNTNIRTSNLILGGANAITTIVNNAAGANGWANTKVASVSGTSGRITSSGGTTPAIDLAAAGAGAATYSSGISAVTVDAYGRVTSVTGSAGYVTSSGVTSVATGTGLTGGTITSTGTLSVDFATVATVTNAAAAFGFANGVSINAAAAFAHANASYATGNIEYALTNAAFATANAAFGAANGKVSSVTGTSGRITSSGGTTPAIDLATSGVTAQTASGGISSITVDTYGRITGIVGSAGYITSGLANTSGISFNGDLFFPTGNVAIGSGSATFNSVAYRLYVNGAFAANTKSFVIDHPTKPNMKLQHGSLEGPENGVYVRGKINGYVINLPDYWTGLVDEDTITVQLTAIGESQSLYVVEVNHNKVIICGENGSMPYCYYTIYGERKDVGKLIVEY